MRFLVMVKGVKERPVGEKVNRKDLAEMGAFNDTLVRDGILLGMGGLKPTALGARISYDANGKPTVTDGPFTETKELVAGFWLLQARSKEEIVERLKLAPFEDGAVEIRPLYEDEDFEGGA